MDKTLIYGPFETLTISAASDTLNINFLKIGFLLKIKFLILKINEKFIEINFFSKNRLLVSAADR
jgi:hypothetical protein